MISLAGFLPATDPRMRATIDAIQHHLTGPAASSACRDRGTGDGLTWAEGTFLLCTFWLARCLALADDTRQARAVFKTAIGHVSDVGCSPKRSTRAPVNCPATSHWRSATSG